MRDWPMNRVRIEMEDVGDVSLDAKSIHVLHSVLYGPSGTVAATCKRQTAPNNAALKSDVMLCNIFGTSSTDAWSRFATYDSEIKKVVENSHLLFHDPTTYVNKVVFSYRVRDPTAYFPKLLSHLEVRHLLDAWLDSATYRPSLVLGDTKEKRENRRRVEKLTFKLLNFPFATARWVRVLTSACEFLTGKCHVFFDSGVSDEVSSNNYLRHHGAMYVDNRMERAIDKGGIAKYRMACASFR